MGTIFPQQSSGIFQTHQHLFQDISGIPYIYHTSFHIVEMGCQMVQLLSTDIVGQKIFANLTPALLQDFPVRSTT